MSLALASWEGSEEGRERGERVVPGVECRVLVSKSQGQEKGQMWEWILGWGKLLSYTEFFKLDELWGENASTWEGIGLESQIQSRIET